VAWARRLQAIAQGGLTYSENPFDRDRYQQVRAVAVEMAAVRTGADRERLVELFAGEAGYMTPKVDVRGVVFREGCVLLVRGRDDGRWTVPGGWADVGERPSEAVEKEVREESGYFARATKLIGVRNVDVRDRTPWPFHGYKLFFRCKLVEEKPEEPSPLETDGVGFFAPEDLPQLSRRVGPAGLDWVFEHLRDPDRPADFD
jgi:ADP-ribose pyrophosphatase YjhB (NUDIX family)